MPTAACGINCDVCGLNVSGICSSCGSGVSEAGHRKAAAQARLFGEACPVLACARMNRIEYCLKDCVIFPCENFESGPYPFSGSFLSMQSRRRTSQPVNRDPVLSSVEIPSEYWELLEKRDFSQMREFALAMDHPRGLVIRFLNQDILIDVKNSRVLRLSDDGAEIKADSLTALLILVYLLNVSSELVKNRMIGVEDLKFARFFQGPHEIRTDRLLARYGNDPESFARAAENLGGVPIDMADKAYRLNPLPKIPVYYLLWISDDEFKSRLSILFDKSIESHLPADAIWGLVNRVSELLLKG